MNKRILSIILIIVSIIAIIVGVTLFFVLKNQGREISNYGLFDTTDLEYKYYFESDDEESIVFYNDEVNNSVYVRLCTYKSGLCPNYRVNTYSDVEVDLSCVKSIKSNKDKIIIDLDTSKYRKATQWTLDMDTYDPSPSDSEMYIQINDINCKEIELHIGIDKYNAKPSEPIDIKELLKNVRGYDKVSICNKGKWALVDYETADILIDFISDQKIEYQDDRAIIEKDGLEYLTDLKGNILSDGYLNVQFFNINDEYEQKRFKNCIKVSNEDEDNGISVGLIDRDGKLVQPTVYEKAEYIFLDANFRFASYDIRSNMITDLNGNRIGNDIYSTIYQLTPGYYNARVFTEYSCALLDNNGNQIYKGRDEITLASSVYVLFKIGTVYGSPIIDKNGKTRFDGLYIEYKEKDTAQPILKQPQESYLRKTPIIDGVTIDDSIKEMKLLNMTDEDVTIQYEENGVMKTYLIKDGKKIEK